MINVRKLKLVIRETDKELRSQKYKFIRDSQYAQYRALNVAMGYISSAYLKANKDIKSEEYKEAIKLLTNSNPIFNGIEVGTGIDTLSAVTRKARKDFSASLKNGLARGERNLTSYRRTYPLITRGRDLKFRYEGNDIVIKWVNKIEFTVITGSNNMKENTIELKHTLHKIINNEYKIKESSLMFDKNNNLFLNLTFDIPDKEVHEIVSGRTLGVDLGIATPAYVCLSDTTYIRSGFGSANDFFRVRQQMKDRRKKLYASLTVVKGGKGRNKKVKAADHLRDKERNFAKTYNHQLSHKIVKFAKDNKCEFINLEYLTKDGFENRILSSWSYYELQNMIEYKAEREGIKVRYVDPAYTSQTCSKCGHVDKENRPTQAKFKCVNCGLELNADHNASINIARSDNFVNKKKKKKEDKQEE
jgi:IS605 OrfB family transposase